MFRFVCNAKILSLSHKITFSLIVVSLGACLVLGVVVYYSMKEAMLERTYDQLLYPYAQKNKTGWKNSLQTGNTISD
ncbi:MAG: hypothetical protein ACP5DZ_09885 [Bacteroidales bacterium]